MAPRFEAVGRGRAYARRMAFLLNHAQEWVGSMRQADLAKRAQGERTGAPVIGRTFVVMLCAALLAVYSGAWLVRDVIVGVSPVPQAALRFLGVPLALLGGVFIALKPLQALRLISEHWALLLLIIWAGLSTFWSADPATTVLRTIAIVMAFFAAIGLCIHFDARALARMTTIAVLIGMGLSLILYVAGDPLAQTEIGLRGAFTHKNSLGQVTSIGVVLGAGLAIRPGDRWLGLLTLAAGLACLVLARSATALAACAAGVALLPAIVLLGSARLPRFTKPALIVGGVLGALVLGMSYTLVLELLGRDPSLTNRDLIWEFTLDNWSRRPLTGFGFRAFWTAPYNIGLVHVYFYDAYDQSHNGFLQILLDLGLVGLSLFVLWLLFVFLRVPGVVIHPDKRIWVVLWVVFLIYAMTEAIFLAPNGFTWFVVTLAAMIITPIERKQAPRASI